MAKATTSKAIRLKVFRSLCWHDNDLMSCWVPLPATLIAQQLGISVYQCRKHMRALVEEGLAARTHINSVVFSEDSSIPYHGFTLTDKGRKTGIYYYTSLRSARIAAHCFGGSVESFLPAGFDTRWLRKDERRPENNPAGFLAGLEKELEEALC